MAYLRINNVAIKGVSACVPKTIRENRDSYKWGNSESFINSTGIERLHITDKLTCTSDLCIIAAERLLDELNWERDEINAIIFVTQTPDYVLPATSNIIQSKLGLSQDCYALDISLGCSGWVYALSAISGLMQNGTIKKGLLLSGDTISKFCASEDKSTFPLFGDAGTATALEYCEDVNPMCFCMHSDGDGFETIIIRDGGYRNQTSQLSFADKTYGNGIIRNRLNLELDGMSVFSFGISKAPKVVKELLGKIEKNESDIDFFIFHQANLFMNEKIREKLKLKPECVPYSLKDFGNTSCASIPLTLVNCCRERLKSSSLKNIGCGFGVGLSWGAVYFETSNIKCPELIEI